MFTLEVILSLKLGVRLAIATLLFIKYLEEKTNQVKWWSIAWYLLGFNDVIQIFLFYSNSRILVFIAHSTVAVAGISFFISSAQNLAADTRKRIIWGTLIAGILGTAIFTIKMISWFWCEVYSTLFLSCGLLYTAGTYYRQCRKKLNFADYLIFLGFLAWGIFGLLYPFGQTLTLTRIKFMIVMLFSLPFGIGLVLKSGDALRIRLLEKTRELEQAQFRLIQNERVAIIGQMAAMVSHELKNPLMGMKTAAYYIKRNIDRSQVDAFKAIEDIEMELLYSDNIIANILTFARPQVPVFLIGNINKIIEDTLSNFAEQKIAGEVVIEKHLETLPEILLDAAQIRQVIVNLLLNAIQSIAEGGYVDIYTKYKNKNIEIIIRDNGCGIPDDIKSKLYTPFFTTKARGTGLGLSIVKNIIERHGGSILLNSELGKGTELTISIPAAREMKNVA